MFAAIRMRRLWLLLGTSIAAWSTVEASDWYVAPKGGGCPPELLASDRASGDYFDSVSFSGNVILVGTRYPGNYRGAAYVFRYDGAAWIEEQKLVASDSEELSFFGNSAALDGNVAIIGAPFENDPVFDAGAAYVFRYDGSKWVEEQKLTASDATAENHFGMSVAIQGDLAVVGAPNKAGARGRVYVFQYDGTRWNEVQDLRASDRAVGDAFGSSISLSGDLIAVGAPFKNGAAGQWYGAAYMYRMTGGQWTEEQKLVASDEGPFHSFGYALAVDGERVLIGAAYGSYMFRRTGNQWIEEHILRDERGDQAVVVGLTVDLEGDVALIGGQLFRFDGTGWTEDQVLATPDRWFGAPGGRLVSIDQGIVVVGTPSAVNGGISSGEAHVFDARPPQAAGDEGDPFSKVVDAVLRAVDGDTIFIAAGVYPCENLVLHEDLRLVGQGGESMVTLDGSTAESVLIVMSDASVEVNGLAIVNGNGRSGGGIYVGSSARLTLTGVTVSANVAHRGGGLYNAGTTSMVRSTIGGCKAYEYSYYAGHGGGIYSLGTLDLQDSAVFQNTAFDTAFDFSLGGGILSAGTLTSARSTVARNYASRGGGLWTSGLASVGHTIFAANHGPTFAPDCEGTLTSLGYNLVQDPEGCNIVGDSTGNQIGVDPLFADPPKGDFSLQPGSPALDAGAATIASCERDRAGSPRVLDGNLDGTVVVDIGAYEFDHVSLEILGQPSPGETLTVNVSGTPGLLAILWVGTSPGEISLSPYGCLYVDLGVPPVLFLTLGDLPVDPLVGVLPPNTPPGLTIVFQALAVTAGGGNFSNDVVLVVQ